MEAKYLKINFFFIQWDEFSKGKIEETTKELTEERDLALEFLKSQK
jgi:hypothetical protein